MEQAVESITYICVSLLNAAGLTNGPIDVVCCKVGAPQDSLWHKFMYLYFQGKEGHI